MRAAIATALGLLLLPMATVARGQDEVGASEDVQDPYDALIEGAVAHFGAHRFEESHALFRRAHALRPSARTLRGLGMTAYELGEHADAYRLLTDALADPRNPLPDDLRASTEGLRERAESLVALVTVRTVPADAVLRVDGAPPVVLEGRVLLGIGRHRIDVRAEGHEPLERTLDVAGGERTELVLELDASRPVPPRRMRRPAPSLPAPATAPRRDDIGPAILLSTAAGASIASVIVGVVGWLGGDAEIATCDAAGGLCLNADALRVQRDAAIGGTVSAAVLGAATALAGLLWLLAEEPGSAAALRCAPMELGAACVGRF